MTVRVQVEEGVVVWSATCGRGRGRWPMVRKPAQFYGALADDIRRRASLAG